MAVRRISYGDLAIEYTVVTRDIPAAKVRIHVEPDARVVVDAPAGATGSQIAIAVRKRAHWISGHLQRIREGRQVPTRRDWVSGESHRYLGRRYMLKVRVEPTEPERAALSGGQLRVYVKATNPERVKLLVHAWYHEHASEWLRRRVEEIARALPWVKGTPAVAMRLMKSRWGSCSPAGRLTLNPLLVRAPREAIDYVIIHELCHLRHHDHGRAFYALLGRYVPGWQVTKKRLDAMADALLAEQG